MRINGHPLKCGHCGCASFSHSRAQLNTAGMTFLNLDWLNKSADIFTCSECGHLEWFIDARITPDPGGPGRDCGRCGYFISESVAVCPNCGEPR